MGPRPPQATSAKGDRGRKIRVVNVLGQRRKEEYYLSHDPYKEQCRLGYNRMKISLLLCLLLVIAGIFAAKYGGVVRSIGAKKPWGNSTPKSMSKASISNLIGTRCRLRVLKV